MNSKHLHDFLALLRFPSISTNPDNHDEVRACAGWLANKLSSIGLHAQVHPTSGHPVVVARNDHKPDLPTVMIYGHYDVQPVDPIQLWDSPPFEPLVKEEIVYARGATDNKGQILSHILGVQTQLEENGSLPVNIIFLIEGEEEIGSPSLAPFLKEHKEDLACDVVLISDTGMIAPETPTFTYGLRGVACLELSLTGPDKDLHSGIFGGAIANPLSEISKLVASLHDSEGRVNIDGFYDDVEPLSSWERDAWKKLSLDDHEFIELSGAPELFGEPGYSAFEQTWARPTAELNGLYGGYQGEGSKTVIPSLAQAKISFRLVPNQISDDILQKAENHFRKQCSSAVKLEIEKGHSGDPYLVDPNTGFGKAARDALKKVIPNKEPAVIREGGSIPIVSDFKEILGVDSLLLGLALPDCQIHSPNENFPLRNLELGQEINKAVLEAIRDCSKT
ncbi:MAG: dipeptidase [Verrucomicrobiota bacterium]